MSDSKRGNQVFDFFRNVFKFKILEDVLVSLTKGREFGTFFTKLPPNVYSYPKPSIRIVKRGGVRLELDLSDLVDWYSFWGFKEKSRELLLSSISAGFSVIDVGANNGVLSLEFAQIAGDEGKVLAVEPHPFNVTRIKRNLSLNEFSNIQLIEKGVGAKGGKSFIEIVDENNLGKNRIREIQNGGIQIEIQTLEELVRSNHQERIDLIKIDVEGFEMQVLSGGLEVIKKFKPILFIEIDDNNLKEQGSSAAEVIAFLEQNDYSSIHAENHKTVDSQIDLANCHFDVLSTPI